MNGAHGTLDWRQANEAGQMTTTVNVRSTITCPECGFARDEEMPVDACVFFYICTNCQARLRPLPGDCCVFCSYGTVPCPPCQTPVDQEQVDERG